MNGISFVKISHHAAVHILSQPTALDVIVDTSARGLVSTTHSEVSGKCLTYNTIPCYCDFSCYCQSQGFYVSQTCVTRNETAAYTTLLLLLAMEMTYLYIKSS